MRLVAYGKFYQLKKKKKLCLFIFTFFAELIGSNFLHACNPPVLAKEVLELNLLSVSKDLLFAE